MANDPKFISVFNQIQMDPSGSIGGFDDFVPGEEWVGEWSPNEGELLVSGVLVGPYHAGSPATLKKWERITFKGEGRAMVMVWIDGRKVAQGMVTLGKNLKNTNRLNLPRGKRTGCEILALVMLHGRMLEVKCWWTNIKGKE